MKEFCRYLEDWRQQRQLSDLLHYRCDNLCALLPYRAYDSNEGVYYNAHSIGFILEITPFCGADEQMIDTFSCMIADGIPANTVMQLINYASPAVEPRLQAWANGLAQENPIYQELIKRRLQHYEGSNWHGLLNSADSVLRDFRVFIAVSFLQGNNLEELKRLRQQLQTTIRSLGGDSFMVTALQLLNLLSSLIHPSTQASPEVIWDEWQPLNQNLLRGDGVLEVNERELLFERGVEKIAVRSYTAQHFPHLWAQWMSGDLIGDFYSSYQQIPCPMLTHLTIFFPDVQKTREKAKVIHLNSIRKSRSGIGFLMPRVNDVTRDWEFVVKKLEDEGQRLVQIYYGVTLYALADQMDKCERSLQSLYSTKGWTLQPSRYLQLPSWLSALPFAFDSKMKADYTLLDRLKKAVTWTCANIAPLQGEWKGMSNPLTLLLGRRGQVMGFNPFSNLQGNYNTVFVGKSGSGKSMAMQDLMTGVRMQGGSVFVIDDGRSFMNACQRQGGQFIEFSGDSKLCLNPFSFVNSQQFDTTSQEDHKQQTYCSEVVNLLKNIIARMCKRDEDLTQIESSLVSQAILSVWLAKRMEATITDIATYLQNSDDSRARDLGVMLQPYTKDGVYGYLFNEPANLDLSNPYTVFELKELQNKRDLQSVVFTILMYMITEMMERHRHTKSVLVVDEAWKFLRGEAGGEFVEGIARRARKYNGALVTGTQSLYDFYESKAAKAALDNSDFKVLMMQSTEVVDRLQAEGKLNLTEAQAKALKSLQVIDYEYSEMMIIGPNNAWSVARLILDPYTLCLYSSKGEDFEAIKQYQAQGFSLEEALDQRVQDIQRRS